MFEPSKALALLRQKTAGLPRAIENQLIGRNPVAALSHTFEGSKPVESLATLYNRAVPNKVRSTLEGRNWGSDLRSTNPNTAQAAQKGIDRAIAISPGLRQARAYAAEAANPTPLNVESRAVLRRNGREGNTNPAEWFDDATVWPTAVPKEHVPTTAPRAKPGKPTPSSAAEHELWGQEAAFGIPLRKGRWTP